jgi:hypothetical protein
VLAGAEHQAGIASGVNNAVARAAALIAVALLPALAGLTGAAYRHPAAFSSGFHKALLIAAGGTFLGGAIAFLGIRNPAPVGVDAAGDGAAPRPVSPPQVSCPVDAPPLRHAVPVPD